MAMVEQISDFDPKLVNLITTPFYPGWLPGQLDWHSGQEVTPTLAQKMRGDLAVLTINVAAGKGVNVIIVEATGNHPFREAITRPNVHIYKETVRGMSAGRQEAFEIADTQHSGIANLWIEPEKLSIVLDCMSQLMIPIIKNEAALTIPWRDEVSFSTYPDFQADTEIESNKLWNDLLKSADILPQDHPGLDVWIGPRSWHRNITPLFLRKYVSTDPTADLVKPDEYCNAIYFPVIAALIAGEKVLSVPVPYRNPKIQTAMEQDSQIYRDKRKYQRDSILRTTEEYIALHLGRPSKLALVV